MTQLQPKIVQVAAHYPPFLGGTEAVVYQIATGLARRGYETEVVTSRIGYRASWRDDQITGYTVKRLAGRMVANVPIIPGLFGALMRQPRGSVFHVHVAQAFIPEVVLVAARLKRAACIVHFHLDVQASGRFGFLFTLYKKTLFPLMLRAADTVIVFSDDQQKLVTGKYGVRKAKVAIIPNGVDESFFQEKKHRLPARPRLLFAGRLSPQKNLQQLLYALEGVSDRFATTIVGDGELEAELRALAKRLALRNVNFAGRVASRAMPELYQRADIFVLPSIREGMPLVLLEAMASGLPVVATDVLGNRDLVQSGHNGLLVALNDPADMQKALLKIAENTKGYAAMSHQAHQTALDYSWQNVLGALERLYRG